MRLRDLRKLRHNGHREQREDETAQTLEAEEWTMSDDVGYMGTEMDWACPSSSSMSSTSHKGRSWLGTTGLVVGLLALGTALFVAFAPRDMVRRSREAISEAFSRGRKGQKGIGKAGAGQAKTSKEADILVGASPSSGSRY